MLPLLEKRTFRVRWSLTVSEDDTEVACLGAGPPGGEQLQPIVAQDAQSKLDERSGPGVAGMPDLLSSDPLWGGTRGSPPFPDYPWGPYECA